MTGALTLVALFVIGAAFGRWVQGRAASTRKLVFRSTWIVLGAPVALFVQYELDTQATACNEASQGTPTFPSGA